jgi:hypothetical protein
MRCLGRHVHFCLYHICQHVSILKYVNMLAYEVDLYQVSFSKYALSVLYGGLIGGRGAIFFAGLDNKL